MMFPVSCAAWWHDLPTKEKAQHTLTVVAGAVIAGLGIYFTSTSGSNMQSFTGTLTTIAGGGLVVATIAKCCLPHYRVVDSDEFVDTDL